MLLGENENSRLRCIYILHVESYIQTRINNRFIIGSIIHVDNIEWRYLSEIMPQCNVNVMRQAILICMYLICMRSTRYVDSSFCVEISNWLQKRRICKIYGNE